jgi:endonuclease/exonuclease/phosphatase family metal-dependent hydrolase
MRRLHPFLGLASLCAALLVASPADASAWPTTPTGIRVTAVASSTFTVGLKPSTNARSYRLYVSTLKSDLFYRNLVDGIASPARRVYFASTPSLRATGLSYTTNPYYYRVEALNGTRRSYAADIPSLGLRPAVPTGLAVHGSYLLWSAGRATGFTIEQATDPAMTANVHAHTIRGEAHQYTPYGVTPGSTYYFRVRAMNQSTPSAYTPAVTMTVPTQAQSVKVMTYNILKNTSDLTTESGNLIAPWSQRRLAAAALIKSVDPDVLGVQEGNNWVGTRPGTRQVDSLNSELVSSGASYAIAATEITYPNRGWSRTGDYILYKTAVYRAYAAGGHFSIGDGRWGAYQPLENRATGARFLFVCTHLIAGSGRTADLTREAEATRLVQQTSAKAATLGVPVVYAGDFNSNQVTKQHPVDGPGIVMRGAHLNDARMISPIRHLEQYDSMNQYRRRPFTYYIYIDYVFAGPGVAVTAWGSALHLSGGEFVGTIPSDHNAVYATLRYAY